MSTLITELGYLGFEVSDLPRWEQFAGDVLGLVVSKGPRPDTRLLRMDDHRYRFILTEGPADDYAFAGWRAASPAAVEAFGQHLDSLDIPWSWGSDDELALRAVQRMLHFKDPVGNRHEVFCGPALATDRFSSPKVAGGFLTGDGGLGHVVFSSSDYPKTIEFARKVLGLEVSDVIRMPVGPGMHFEVSFFHGNSRHHSFAVAPQPPTPGPHKRIHHFMVEVNSIEQVGFGRDRCLAMGQPVSMDIGQHPNDRMISYYGTTPSGFHVEFGWGGVQVDRDTWQVVTYDKLSEWGHRPSTEGAAKPPAKAASSNQAPVSAAGQWSVVIKTPIGDDKVVFDLQVEGGVVTGAIQGATETNDLYDGKIDGATLTWGVNVSTPMPMALEFTATVDGDSISGSAKSPFGAVPFSGSRA